MLLLKGLVAFYSMGIMSFKVKVHNPCRASKMARVYEVKHSERPIKKKEHPRKLYL
jgi:hypothetical protein